MAFSVVGPASAQSDSTVSTINLSVTTTIPVGDMVLVVFGGDSNTVALSSVSDSNGNTYDWAYIGASEGNGNIGIAWATVTSELNTSDTISISYGEANDSQARAYHCTGAQANEITTGTKTYTTGTWSITLNPASAGVMIAAFEFPFDWSWTPTVSGWTKGGEFDDGADQTCAWFYKSVSAGSNTCSGSGSLSHLAAAVVLPEMAHKSDSDTLTVTVTESESLVRSDNPNSPIVIL